MTLLTYILHLYFHFHFHLHSHVGCRLKGGENGGVKAGEIRTKPGQPIIAFCPRQGMAVDLEEFQHLVHATFPNRVRDVVLIQAGLHVADGGLEFGVHSRKNPGFEKREQ